MIDGYVITIQGDQISECGADTFIESAKIHAPHINVNKSYAVPLGNVRHLMSEYNIVWNYPWEGYIDDIPSGLRKTAYPTRNKNARISCALSHYGLWKEIAKDKKPAFIFEHDALFTKNMPENLIPTGHKAIVGINSPKGATRRAQMYHDKVQSALVDNNKPDIVSTPKIDEEYIPQGLAGNSAYYMSPSSAKLMLETVKDYGLWPNDAIMCRQLHFRMGQTTTYYTTVQGLPSTTSN